MIENTETVSKIIVSDEAFESNEYEKISEADTAEYFKRYIQFAETKREQSGCLITYYEKKVKTEPEAKLFSIWNPDICIVLFFFVRNQERRRH